MKKPNLFLYYHSHKSKQLHHNVGDDAGKGNASRSHFFLVMHKSTAVLG